MTSIHPFVYMAIGIVISAYSWFIDSKSEGSFLQIFIWIGGIFFLVGLIKLLFRKYNKESEKKQKQFDNKYKKVDQGFKNQNQQFYNNNQNNNQNFGEGIQKY